MLSAWRFDYVEFTLHEIGVGTLKIESMVSRSMSVALFAVAIVCAAAAAEPRPGAVTALEFQEVDGVDLDELLALARAHH